MKHPDHASFHLDVRPSFWLLAAFLLAAGSRGGLFPLCLLACAFHELGHLTAAFLLGLPVRRLSVSALGLELEIPRNCPYWGEFLLAAAGPGASLLLTLVLRPLAGDWSASLAGISLLQGLFNLLPLQPLDGGEMLRILLAQFLPPDRSWKAARWAGYAVCLPALCAGGHLALLGNPSLLLLSLALIAGHIRSGKRGDERKKNCHTETSVL